MWANWTEAFKNKRFVIAFILSMLAIALFAISLPYFFNEILLPKPGFRLRDPILLALPTRDWSIEIFLLLYSLTLISLALNIKRPATLLLLFQLYAVVNFLRLASLYAVTLEAPEGIIPLSDPFLTLFAYGKEVYVKDLFFSGHISTLCILFIIEQRKVFAWVILTSTLVVAVFLAWQRVHYTLDILAAPLVTWLVFRF
ncbi:MAG TPA: phosphatase PAP2-related protein, partial [Cyclobacteriaceae bacterium]|nr:phosphatase PAP2-related protein [Cyclobacteriaceae bacterium]